MSSACSVSGPCVRYERQLCKKETKIWSTMLSDGTLMPMHSPGGVYECDVCVEHSKL